MVNKVQVTLGNGYWADALSRELGRNGAWRIESVPKPDFRADAIFVLDQAAFDRVSATLPCPDRVVLVTRNEPRLLMRAWEAGVVAVVFEDDAPSTAALSVLASALRLERARKHADCAFTPTLSKVPARTATILTSKALS